ncbi:MAG TPA: NADPH:quinone oxidoreductase family protein [Jatrophihabitans sp.]|nr:NADPH:quinone oxidoreductase family protein [Jatrophihabitans sp.]
MRAVRIESFGGPEVLQVVEVPEPVPGPDEVVADVRAAGVNYADTHAVEDSYLSRQALPLIPGGEVILDLPGGRALGMAASGGYAQRVAVNPARLIGVPDGISDGQALSCLVQGASAWHLLRTSAHLRPGETVVVHAAAGGVGTLAVQLAALWGAGRVIATASTPAKRELALSLGADAAVDSTEPELAQALRAANDGRRVDVVLEMTGGAVFDQSLAALAPFGRLVCYGMAGRIPPTAVQPAALMAHSTAVIGFWLAHAGEAMLAEAVTDLFELILAGKLSPVLGPGYPLDRVADAHRALRSRQSTGKLILLPNG